MKYFLKLMLIVKNVAVIATGNQNGGIWWVMKRTIDKIQVFSSKFVGFQQFFLRPIFFLCLMFYPLVGRPIKFQALGVLKKTKHSV